MGDAGANLVWQNKRRATGLKYSAGTFVQKTGGGFAGALVLVVLAGYGYNGMDESTVTQALPGMQSLISWIPAIFAFLGAVLMVFYPLTPAMTAQITSDLAQSRAGV